MIECLIDKGILAPPEDGIGAEGCWMSVEKKGIAESNRMVALGNSGLY